MNRGFWDKLNKPARHASQLAGVAGRPIMALAPMANVTDAAFRQMIAKYGKPDVMWTEFVSADGLASAGKEKLLVDFWYGKTEHPIVAQVFGANPENMFKAGELIRQLKFDGLDINMGCPDRAVLKQGAGGALIKNPTLAKELILAAQEGAKGLPVSVKTRIGVNKPMLEEWLGFLAKQKLAAIIVHLRTVKEQSLVPAHWELMSEIVRLVKHVEGAPPHILGNGDVASLKEAEEKCAQTGADGVMIGRGIFGNPWLFNRKHPIEKVPVAKRLKAMIEHTKLFEKKFVNLKVGPDDAVGVGGKRFEVMKKHFKAYVNGFNGAKELRMQLMEAENAKEVTEVVGNFLKI